MAVATTDDAGNPVYEGPETFTLTAATSTDTDTGTATIHDDGTNGSVDDRPGISVNDLDVAEGNTANFAVTLDEAAEADVVVNLGLANGSAETDDYSQTMTVTYVDGGGVTQTLAVDGSGNVTVPAGITALNVAVATTDDAGNPVYEGPETFTLTAATSTDTDTGTATIHDDGTNGSVDDRPGISVNDLDVAEGNTANFAVTLDKAAEADVVVNLGLANGSAETDDYSQTMTVTYVDGGGVTQTLAVDGSGNVTVPAGITALNVAVATTDDAGNPVYEGPETFTLTAATSTDTDTGTATIHDDGTNGSVDDRPGISVNDLDVAEGNTANFAVNLGSASQADLVVNLGLANGSAETDDYSQTMTVTYVDGGGVTQTLVVDGSGNVTVPAGITALNVAVATTDDAGNPVYEGPETFTLTAATSTDTDTGTATIHDDGTNGSVDDRPGISVNDLDVAEGNTANFAVNLGSKASQADRCGEPWPGQWQRRNR